jgi:hypothetical protein
LKKTKYLLLIAAMLCTLWAAAQKDSSLIRKNVPEGSSAYVVDSAKQRDMIDLLLRILKKDTASNSRLKAKKLIFSVVPAFGFSLTTGFAADITANMAFYTGAAHSAS